MMLSEQERREMLEDAHDDAIRRAFQASKEKCRALERPMTLDEYIDFLQGIQEVFGPFEISRKPTPTKNNLL